MFPDGSEKMGFFENNIIRGTRPPNKEGRFNSPRSSARKNSTSKQGKRKGSEAKKALFPLGGSIDKRKEMLPILEKPSKSQDRAQRKIVSPRSSRKNTSAVKKR